MVTTITDPTTCDRLAKIEGQTEIQDATGRVLGYFIPADRQLDAMYEAAAAHFDPVEMRRRLDTPGPRYATAEVLEYCRSRESA